ncbi:DUF4136 domain-containing protein [Granulibacter bethesdensis]|uniref:DUF4136 domain-containing protein n=1 Tax=Granulibacter bethesdensis TaxID=364410 RepID=UPI00092FE169|nr:DUF4136 domain-containing protein [Granulibacter bethesdensis]
MKCTRVLIALLLIVCCAGCDTLNPFEGPYHPPGAPLSAEGPADIAVVPPISGATPSQAATVEEAALQALEARNLLSEAKPDSARLVMRLTVLQWDVTSSGGRIALGMSLFDRATGKKLYEGRSTATNLDGPVLLNPATLATNAGLLVQDAMGKLLSQQDFMKACAEPPHHFLFFQSRQSQ